MTGVLKLKLGETAVIRNVGGRVNPALFETRAILGTVSKAAGEAVGTGWNLVVLQHTDCGINGCYRRAPKLLSKYMGVADDKLDDLAITDPYKAVAFTVTGLVYDVKTGLVETVVSPEVLRPEQDQGRLL